MPKPVNLSIDSESKQIYVLFDDGSVDVIRGVSEPHDPHPEWREVAPPNPKTGASGGTPWNEAEDEPAVESSL